MEGEVVAKEKFVLGVQGVIERFEALQKDTLQAPFFSYFDWIACLRSKLQRIGIA